MFTWIIFFSFVCFFLLLSTLCLPSLDLGLGVNDPPVSHLCVIVPSPVLVYLKPLLLPLCARLLFMKALTLCVLFSVW